MGFHKQEDHDIKPYELYFETPKEQQEREKKRQKFKKTRDYINQKKDDYNNYKKRNVDDLEYLKKNPEKINERVNFSVNNMLKLFLFTLFPITIITLLVALANSFKIMQYVVLAIFTVVGIFAIFYYLYNKFILKKRNNHRL